MYHPTDNYWTQIIAHYKQLPDYLSVSDKWHQAYAYMRVHYPPTLPEIPKTGNHYAREYAMALRAMIVFRCNQVVLSEHFFKEWSST